MNTQQAPAQGANGTQTKETTDFERLLAKKTIDPLAFEPDGFEAAEKLAKKLYESGLVLGGAKKWEQVLGLIFFGRDLGLSVGQTLRMIEIVEGHPSLRAQGAVALVKRSPQCEWWRVVETTNERAVIQTKRRGAPEPETFTYTIQDAQKAGLLNKPNWKHPIPMLLNRCGAIAAKHVYTDVTAGIAIVEEMQDEYEKPGAIGDEQIDAANTLPPSPSIGTRADALKSMLPPTETKEPAASPEPSSPETDLTPGLTASTELAPEIIRLGKRLDELVGPDMATKMRGANGIIGVRQMSPAQKIVARDALRVLVEGAEADAAIGRREPTPDAAGEVPWANAPAGQE